LARRMKAKRRRLNSARVLVGISGSVAAYKAVDLIRRLRDEGASVKAIMTEASCRFITPLSIELAAGPGNVFTGMFDNPMAHIELAVESDLMVVAPATANTVGKFAQGLAGDLLGACFMSYRGPVVLAPAMNWRMYESPAFRENLSLLKQRGAIEVEPDEGPLACGEYGKGRMAPVERIVEAAKAALCEKDLKGMKVVVTAGPTREHIDEVRFISNRSSGKMGYALARAAASRGAKVTLISGPTALTPPDGASFISVTSARQMLKAVLEEASDADALVMNAAVADFAPSQRMEGKSAKEGIGDISLSATPDILAEVSRLDKKPFVVGFAAEAGEDTRRAEDKRIAKGADFMVLNNISDPEAGFDVDTNRITVLGGDSPVSHPLMSKEEAAHVVLDLLIPEDVDQGKG